MFRRWVNRGRRVRLPIRRLPEGADWPWSATDWPLRARCAPRSEKLLMYFAPQGYMYLTYTNTWGPFLAGPGLMPIPLPTDNATLSGKMSVTRAPRLTPRQRASAASEPTAIHDDFHGSSPLAPQSFELRTRGQLKREEERSRGDASGSEFAYDLLRLVGFFDLPDSH